MNERRGMNGIRGARRLRHRGENRIVRPEAGRNGRRAVDGAAEPMGQAAATTPE
jgi:hypothetical protein